MSDKLNQLTDKLKELFQLNRPDLDFGIYRIMHAKQDEIERFLESDLLPQVRAGLAELGSGKQAEIEADIEEAIKQAEDLGVEKPKETKKVKELRAKYGSEFNEEQAEDEIYSHLYNFFARYYQDGDFMSMRRYKEGVYSIPYEGEEVYLHWANKDQYYIKTSENLKNYTFKLDDGRKVTFRILEADTEKDNKKAADDKERRFILNPDSIAQSDDGQILVLGFEYRPDDKKRNQSAINEECVAQIQSKSGDLGVFATGLLSLRPTDKRKDRTLLEKHLEDYTAKHTFDYFIHKDLGKFLSRELDFYIKNEVMHLDDIEHETAQRVEQYLTKVKVIRKIAGKIIDFLAQLENFQKKLWLKKKFVVETNYCITLDRVPEELYPEIAKNDAQWEEWGKLGFVNLSQKGAKARKSHELALDDQELPSAKTMEYLKAFPCMVIDTKFYDSDFCETLVSSLDDLDDSCDGVLVHSENSQALNLLKNRYNGITSTIYIDPPYNTSDNAFLYKNQYKHSSWLSMLAGSIQHAPSFLPEKGVLMGAIDDTEYSSFKALLSNVFGQSNYVGTISIEVNPAGQNLRPNVPARSHDYCHIFAKDIDRARLIERALTAEEIKQYKEKDEIGRFYWDNLRRRGGNSRPADRPKQWFPLFVKDENVRVPVMEWDTSKQQWTVQEKPKKGESEAWPIDPKGEKRIWRVNPDGARREIAAGNVAVIHKAGRQEVSKKSREPEGKKPKTHWSESKYSGTTYGSKLLSDILGSGLHFSYPKSLHLVIDALRDWADESALVLDFFAGSGTTGHAIVALNREEKTKRKYILVEMGDYFSTTLKPRIQKVAFSASWKNGRPTDAKTGISHCFKYIRLESYEDCLNNLKLSRTEAQDELLIQHDDLREDYMLNYMLDVEAKGSVLNITAFEDPFAYKMNIATGTVGETKPVTVDLVETFNYLIGLKVKHIDNIRDVRVITGENLDGDRILVLWRKVKELDSDALDEWFKKQGYNTQDMEFDLIYVNGDNNLENLKKDEQTWKVRLIEDEFQRLMFEEVE